MSRTAPETARVGGSAETRRRHIERRARTCRPDLTPGAAHSPHNAPPPPIGQLGAACSTADAIPIDPSDGQQASGCSSPAQAYHDLFGVLP